jgi:hypothetical protein
MLLFFLFIYVMTSDPYLYTYVGIGLAYMTQLTKSNLIIVLLTQSEAEISFYVVRSCDGNE